MSTHQRIRKILGAAFSADVGLSNAAQREILLRALDNHDWRVAFQNELLEAFSSAETSWIELLSNDEYEVIDSESEDEARTIAASMLWEPTFPGEHLPEKKY